MHDLFPLSNTLGVILARLAHVKVILSTRRDYGLWLANRFGLLLLQFANRFVTRIIANSHNVALLTSREEEIDLSKIDVIYNGIAVNTSQWHPSERDAQINDVATQKNGPIVGIIGGLKPMKRHYTFIRSAQNVLRKREDVKFLVVGDGPCRKNLEELADELKVKDCIHFAGSQDDIKPYISLFDIAVNCSSNEGLSNAIMEYMAYGVPCIVSRAGGNEELIEHNVNGYTFELDNDKELADRILSLLEDKEKQSQFISKSKEIVRERLSLEKMVSEYDRYFERLLQDAGCTMQDTRGVRSPH